MMEMIPCEYGERAQFDRFCKLVLYHEAVDYLREMQRQRNYEKSLESLTLEEREQLYITDRYPSESYVFSSHGYDLQIDNELVAEAFAALPQLEQSILILRFALDMTDREIARLMGLSRSAVQRRRTKTIQELRIKLGPLFPKGG